ncbi:MAG TPA: sterol desaturase family protein [Polyangiaceae bacterium]|nr:sterol desaturase family protein [Polyangiaceae bacterium]
MLDGEWWKNWAILSPVIISVSAWVIIALEHLFPSDRGQKLFRKGWFTDFFWYTLVQSYFLGLAINFIVHFVDDKTGLSRLGLVGAWPMWAQILFFLVIHDFYIYWFHRAQHRSLFLWRFHEAHHSVADVDWLAGSRSHPIEILVNQTVELSPLVLLGAPPEMALIKATMDAVWGMYIHSNIDVKSGPLQYVINGPELHRWHHSKEYEGYGFNYGTKLAIWDYLFGTAFRPDFKAPGYGLSNPKVPFPDGYFQQLIHAFRPMEKGGMKPRTLVMPTVDSRPESQDAPEPGVAAAAK